MKELRIPELDKLPDIKPRNWTQEQEETLWKYQHKDLNAVAKVIGKSREACRMKLKDMRYERL